MIGPWSEAVVLFQAVTSPGAYHYGAKAHEITRDGRFVIVTVNDNGPLEMHVNDPGLYWPHVLKLPLPTD